MQVCLPVVGQAEQDQLALKDPSFHKFIDPASHFYFAVYPLKFIPIRDIGQGKRDFDGDEGVRIILLVIQGSLQQPVRPVLYVGIPKPVAGEIE